MIESFIFLFAVEKLDLDDLVLFLFFQNFPDYSRHLVLFKIVGCTRRRVNISGQWVIMRKDNLVINLHSDFHSDFAVRVRGSRAHTRPQLLVQNLFIIV